MKNVFTGAFPEAEVRDRAWYARRGAERKRERIETEHLLELGHIETDLAQNDRNHKIALYALRLLKTYHPRDYSNLSLSVGAPLSPVAEQHMRFEYPYDITTRQGLAECRRRIAWLDMQDAFHPHRMYETYQTIVGMTHIRRHDARQNFDDMVSATLVRFAFEKRNEIINADNSLNFMISGRRALSTDHMFNGLDPIPHLRGAGELHSKTINSCYANLARPGLTVTRGHRNEYKKATQIAIKPRYDRPMVKPADTYAWMDSYGELYDRLELDEVRRMAVNESQREALRNTVDGFENLLADPRAYLKELLGINS